MKTNFYEPMIQEEQQASPIRGFQTQIAGTYVLLDDVVTAIRQYAQSFGDPEAGALVHELATWLTSGQPAPAEFVREETKEEVPYTVYGAESDDVSEGVDRVEVYPDPPDDPRPKWYARSIDTGGYILKVTGGSFDREWVIRNAEERWPGIPIHELKSAAEDSKWTEDGTRGVFPSKGPPLRRIWT